MKDVKPVVISMIRYFTRNHIHNIQTEAQRSGFDLRLTASRLSGRRNSDVQILPRYIQRKAKTPIADGRCLGFSYLEFFSQSKSQQNFQIKQTTWTKRSGYLGGGSIPSFHAAFDVSIPRTTSNDKSCRGAQDLRRYIQRINFCAGLLEIKLALGHPRPVHMCRRPCCVQTYFPVCSGAGEGVIFAALSQNTVTRVLPPLVQV